MLEGRLPDGWARDIPDFAPDATGMASRDAGGKVLNAIAHDVSALVGGAADLAPSTKTRLTFEGAGDLEAGTPGGRNMHFGVREHAMGAIANGMALSYLRPFTATFLVFSDYMRPPIRLAAIMELPTIFVFSHDSIGVGEDGPTHQPVEQLAALRAIPGLNVIRPADANETAEAWRVAMTRTRTPICIILSRQKLPTIDRGRYASADQLAKGAYVLADADDPSCSCSPPEARSRWRSARTNSSPPRASARASCPCRPGICSNSSRRAIATRCCPRLSAPASRWSRRARSAGTAMSVPTERR